MSSKVAREQASRAIISFAAPAHERSQQRRDESKKCPSRADAWTLIGRVGIKVAELDEKSLPGLAAKSLDMSSAEIDACLKALGVTVGRPWRKEQKFACLSAWVAVTGRGCVDSHGD